MVGVQQGPRLAVVAFAHVEHRLRLLALALEVEVAAAADVGRTDRAHGQQLAQPHFETIAAVQVVEDAARVGVLSFGPGSDPGVEIGHRPFDLGRVAALEPAVGVDQLGTVQGLGDRLDRGRRRPREGRRGSEQQGGEGDDGAETGGRRGGEATHRESPVMRGDPAEGRGNG